MRGFPITQLPDYKITQSRESYVSLRPQYGAGRTDGRRNPPQPGPRARHDSAQTSWTGQVSRTQSDVRRVSEVFRRDSEAGEGDPEAVGGLSDLNRHSLQRHNELNAGYLFVLQAIVIGNEEVHSHSGGAGKLHRIRRCDQAAAFYR